MISCLSICMLFVINERNLGEKVEEVVELHPFVFVLQGLHFRSLHVFVFLLCVSVPATGNSNLFPEYSLFSCILQNWTIFWL